jgi:hypothetical protein
LVTRKLVILGLASGLALLVAAPVLAQNYPPVPGCTPEERRAFNEQQREERQTFQDQRREEREFFLSTDPTPEERRAFAKLKRQQHKELMIEQRRERREFQFECRSRRTPPSRPDVSRPDASSTSDVTPATRPAITVGHVLLVVGAGLVLLLVRRRLRGRLSA